MNPHARATEKPRIFGIRGFILHMVDDMVRSRRPVRVPAVLTGTGLAGPSATGRCSHRGLS